MNNFIHVKLKEAYNDLQDQVQKMKINMENKTVINNIIYNDINYLKLVYY